MLLDHLVSGPIKNTFSGDLGKHVSLVDNLPGINEFFLNLFIP